MSLLHQQLMKSPELKALINLKKSSNIIKKSLKNNEFILDEELELDDFFHNYKDCYVYITIDNFYKYLKKKEINKIIEFHCHIDEIEVNFEVKLNKMKSKKIKSLHIELIKKIKSKIIIYIGEFNEEQDKNILKLLSKLTDIDSKYIIGY